MDPRSKGCNQLIRQGAIIVESAGDVLQGIAHARKTNFGENPPTVYAADMQSPIDTHELASTRGTIIEKLGVTAVSVDELIEQCNTTAPVVITVLLELELAGRLRRSAGKKVSLTEIYTEEVA